MNPSLAAKQQSDGLSVSTYMEPVDPAGSAALGWLDPAMDASTGSGAEAAVGALYRAQAVGLIRLAYLMLGDRAAAEDVVQDAFFGLYRGWDGSPTPAARCPTSGPRC